MRIGFVCPTYKAKELHRYTEKALGSFFRTTPGGLAVVVDDGSVGFDNAYARRLRALAPTENQIVVERFESQLGLTRSWNKGLSICMEQRADYAIAGNNDVVFTPRWYEGMVQLAAISFSMVGPLSNAPGITAKGQQEISKYIKPYKLTDDQETLDGYAKRLLDRYTGNFVVSKINGFFQFASMAAWHAGKYDENHFYRPANFFNAAGKENPTPFMTLNEDELQARWAKLGMKSAISLSSFIFHYRAVTRGDKYKKGQWFRQND